MIDARNTSFCFYGHRQLPLCDEINDSRFSCFCAFETCGEQPIRPFLLARSFQLFLFDA